MARAQIGSQVVIFILALLIGSLVLLFGYRALRGILGGAEDAAMIQFERDLEKTVRDLSYGSTRRKTLTVPGNHLSICFADLAYLRSLTPPPSPSSEAGKLYLLEKYRVVNDSVFSGSADSNVFLMPDGSESFPVGSLEIEGGLLCLDLSDGRTEVGFRGKGNRTEVIPP